MVININEKHSMVVFPCGDGDEVLTLNVSKWDADKTYWCEFNFMDSCVNKSVNRFKRAWQAFCGKPVNYTGVWCTSRESVLQFFSECVELIEETEKQGYRFEA